MYPVEWDAMKEKCFAGKQSPCGIDRGLQINCKDDYQCIQGRCRNEKEMGKGEVNSFCNDDLDCKTGLICKNSEIATVIKVKRCYSPN